MQKRSLSGPNTFSIHWLFRIQFICRWATWRGGRDRYGWEHLIGSIIEMSSNLFNIFEDLGFLILDMVSFFKLFLFYCFYAWPDIFASDNIKLNFRERWFEWNEIVKWVLSIVITFRKVKRRSDWIDEANIFTTALADTCTKRNRILITIIWL